MAEEKGNTKLLFSKLLALSPLKDHRHDVAMRELTRIVANMMRGQMAALLLQWKDQMAFEVANSPS